MTEITKINSNIIGEVVCNLCKQANIKVSGDVYNALAASYEKESSCRARNFLGQILENLKIAADTSRPICQDTGIVIAFIEVGQNVLIEGDSLENAVNEGVKKAYGENSFRKSIINDPVFERINTNTNTPAIVYTNFTEGSSVKISLSIKGCGSENMSTVKMLEPAAGIEGIVEFIVETVKKGAPSACAPIRVGIGIGGTMEYAALLAKKALLLPVNKQDDNVKLQELKLDILDRLNELKIGANGLGGDVTVFGVNILTHPTHIAALPVAVNINCHASRHACADILPDNVRYQDSYNYEFVEFVENQGDLPGLDINDVEAVRNLNAGDAVLLSGDIYTARDASHKKLVDSIKAGQKIPVELKDKIIYYTGPCPASENEIVGPAGPTTSGRMDAYTPCLLQEGLLGAIGKGVRSEEVLEAFREHKGVYFVATGGVASLLAQKIVEAEIVAYPELGPEAVYRFKIKDFPVTVAVDSCGNSIFNM